MRYVNYDWTAYTQLQLVTRFRTPAAIHLLPLYALKVWTRKPLHLPTSTIQFSTIKQIFFNVLLFVIKLSYNVHIYLFIVIKNVEIFVYFPVILVQSP